MLKKLQQETGLEPRDLEKERRDIEKGKKELRRWMKKESERRAKEPGPGAVQLSFSISNPYIDNSSQDDRLPCRLPASARSKLSNQQSGSRASEDPC
jgi:hypothetical protein